MIFWSLDMGSSNFIHQVKSDFTSMHFYLIFLKKEQASRRTTFNRIFVYFVQNGNNALQTKEVPDKAMAFTQFKRKVNLQ